MTPNDREDMITVLDRRLLSPADFVDRIVIPLLAQAEAAGAENALRSMQPDPCHDGYHVPTCAHLVKNAACDQGRGNG